MIIRAIAIIPKVIILPNNAPIKAPSKKTTNPFVKIICYTISTLAASVLTSIRLHLTVTVNGSALYHATLDLALALVGYIPAI
jgi:hypothetical protein